MIRDMQKQISQLTRMVRSMIEPKALEIHSQQLTIIPVKTTQPQVKQVKVTPNQGPHVVCLNIEQPVNNIPPFTSFMKKNPFPLMYLKHEKVFEHKYGQIEKNGQPATVELRFNQYIYEKDLAYIPRHLGLDYMLDEFFIKNAIEVTDILQYLYRYPNKLSQYIKNKLGLDIGHILDGKVQNIPDGKKRIYDTIMYRIRHQYFSKLQPTYHLSSVPENYTPESYACRLSKQHPEIPFLYSDTSVAIGYCLNGVVLYDSDRKCDVVHQNYQSAINGGYWHAFIDGAKILIRGPTSATMFWNLYKEVPEDVDCDYSDDIEEVLQRGCKPICNIEERL